jgi:hypothetical protein
MMGGVCVEACSLDRQPFNGFSLQTREIRSSNSHRARYRINCLIKGLRDAI